MFRAYARFGVLVQLMAALLAGIGVDALLRTGTRYAQFACLTLVAIAAGEYAVNPATLWRDVLPTSAHRWVTRQPGRVLALDCTPLSQESASVQWLSGYRVTLLENPASDCAEPNLPQKLAATGYTHLIVRRHTADGQAFSEHPVPHGLRVAANFDDGQVFAVTARTPAIYVGAMTGFLPREQDGEWSWRWMGTDAAWTIVNPDVRTTTAVIGIELSAFERVRRLELRLDGHSLQAIVVDPARRIYEIGPFALPPGGHEVIFHPVEPPTVAGDVMNDGDRRRLSFALGTWIPSVRGEQP
jgi:hypothetical protein